MMRMRMAGVVRTREVAGLHESTAVPRYQMGARDAETMRQRDIDAYLSLHASAQQGEVFGVRHLTTPLRAQRSAGTYQLNGTDA